MVPSIDLYDKFGDHISKLSEDEKKKTAFVVPAFEARSDDFIPKYKYDLLQSLKMDNVRRYAFNSCRICQKDTKYEQWEKTEMGKNSSYDIRRKSAHYEPFYILHSASYPVFDERFAGRGRNRQSQVNSG